MYRIPKLLDGPQAAVLAFGALTLAGSFIIPAMAITEAGPLQVNDHVDAFAIEGNTTNAGRAGVIGQNAGARAGAGVLGRNRAPHGAGVEGASSSATYGTGVLGTSLVGPGVYGLTANAYPGVIGSSTYKFGTGVSGISSGDAVYGESSAENGVVGITRSLTLPGVNKIFAGVLGIDASSGRTGTGAVAINYGVAGTTANSQGAGIAGFGSGGATGVIAHTDTGTALFAENATGNVSAFLAQYVTPDVSYGVLADAEGKNSTGVSGYSYAGVGVSGGGTIGLNGSSVTPAIPGQLNAALQLGAFTDSNYELVAYCYQLNVTPCNDSGGQVMSVDPSGNMILAGSLSATNVTQSTGSNSSKMRRVAFDTASASPTLEDSGETQLVNGAAAVRLDPAFADSIDPSTKYLIFLTPLGDTPGLYVASRSAQGFVVREHGGGASNIVFDYRIVARPTGRREVRLATYVAPRSLPHSKMPSSRRIRTVARIAPTAGIVSPALPRIDR